VLGKIQMVKLGAGGRNIFPGFGKTPSRILRRFRLRHVARSGPQDALSEAPRAVPFPLVLELFRRPVDQPGRPQRIAFLLVTGVKGPTKVVSFGGRFTLEDDGETPDLQECLYQFPEFMMTMGCREANGLRDPQGAVIMGSKGNLAIGSNQVIPEMKNDPPNLIPRFQGQQPVGVRCSTTPNPSPGSKRNRNGWPRRR